ncbi:VOC family protein [Martelella alba]|uniref:VOC family protein n=1 Tax=Martelella alba TaxID=2590451 RepID=A0A506UK43_9HYPH|nr:VOC family protein [Martelella alba]TPW33633.1 VOC family protein [Martelella alba]
MSGRKFSPRALGEIAIRCRDFSAMQDFYGRILGLERLIGDAGRTHRAGIVFYRLGESFGGHLAVLALFEDTGEEVETGPRSSLHHLALSLTYGEQADAAAWLEKHGCEARFQDFDWAGWRGLFTRDPDGNTVELVAAIPGRYVR